MPTRMRFADLDLRPGLGAGGVTRVGPIPVADYAAVSAQIDVVRGIGNPSGAVFTLKSGNPGNLQDVDSSIVSSVTVGVNASTRIKDCEQLPGDLWIVLTTEEPGASPPYRADIEIVLRSRQDELAGRGAEAVIVMPAGASGMGGAYGPAPGGERTSGEGAPSSGSGA